MKKITKDEKRGKCAARKVETQYIVKWNCNGVIASRTFANLPRTKGYAKEFCEVSKAYIDSGSDKDGSMAAAINSLTIYKATLAAVSAKI
jgi:hypothetical protein